MQCIGARCFPGALMISRPPAPALSADTAAPGTGTVATLCFGRPAPGSAPLLRWATSLDLKMGVLSSLVHSTWTDALYGQTMSSPAMSRPMSPGLHWKLGRPSINLPTRFELSKPAMYSLPTGICCGTSPDRTSASRDSAEGEGHR